MTSAESLFAAISKVVLVLVEFSKKRLKTLLPLRSGTFLTSRSGLVTLTNCCAVSNIWRSVSLGKPSKESKCRSSWSELSCSSPENVGIEAFDLEWMLISIDFEIFYDLFDSNSFFFNQPLLVHLLVHYFEWLSLSKSAFFLDELSHLSFEKM